MENYIDADHWRGAQLLNDVQEHIFQNTQLDMLTKLNPKFMKEGNQFCYLYGEDLQSGIAGFGDTPYLAMRDFNKNFQTQKA